MSAANSPLRIGVVGLGGNTRLRHVPGLLACGDVAITAVCNRRPESTARAMREFGIPRSYEHWQDLVADPEIDAVVIGTWPYLHCPITVAALDAGKHVLCEARMAMNVAEARQMLAAAQRNPALVAQLVPSPLGLGIDSTVKRLLREGHVGRSYLGELREAVVIATNDALADADAPLHWRQVAELSGVNMLMLGIAQETFSRWVAEPVRVFAQATAFTAERRDPETGTTLLVGTPDSVQVLATLAGGAQAIYHASGITRFGPGAQIHLYGSEGTLRIELTPQERIFGARQGDGALQEFEIPAAERGGWNVEADFVASIRSGRAVAFTDFAAGVRYMEFTEAVARSASTGTSIDMMTDMASEPVA
ncbi:MAG: Gfo/Idh/MocA family oxidoreductase [Planctomycetia bacterium]|nr:Gfo/Idh/MocA family oxidoreductase [Planctomycetia bacterium]